MSATSPTTKSEPYRLQVTRYDRVASMLVTLLILMGTVVTVMFIMWVTARIFAPQVAVPVQLEEIGTGDNVLQEGPELDTPPEEEILEEINLNQPQVGETLVAITSVVAQNVAQFDDPSMDRAFQPGGGRRASGGKPGRRRRWEVRFDKSTLERYAKQLDFFGIELGVLEPGNKVVYAHNLSQSKPSQRTGVADEEQRYYLTWQKGELQQADRELLQRAGIEVGNRLILKFVPPEWEAALVELEKGKAGPEYDNVRWTRFGVQPVAEGFEFYVIDQSVR